MKVLRDNRWIGILVTALAIAVVGGVGQPRAEPLSAAPAEPTISITAAVDFFLEIEGVEGSPLRPVTGDRLRLCRGAGVLAQTTTGGGGGGGGAGRLTPAGHVTLIKRIDKASPLLFKRCVDGTVIPRVIGHLARADGQTYLRYELKDVMVSSISHGDVDGDGVLEETLELAFGGPADPHAI